MNNIALLQKWETDKIREQLMESIKKWGENRKRYQVGIAVAYQGEVEMVSATGRAICRCCGNKIAKGTTEIRFFYDAEQNAWNGKEYHLHIHCQPATAQTPETTPKAPETGQNAPKPGIVGDPLKVIPGLDGLETRIYLDLVKNGTLASRALDILVNNAEGDISQLSPALRTWARERGLIH